MRSSCFELGLQLQEPYGVWGGFHPNFLREVSFIRQEVQAILLQDHLQLPIADLNLEPAIVDTLSRCYIFTLGELLQLNDSDLRNLSAEDTLNRQLYKQCKQPNCSID